MTVRLGVKHGEGWFRAKVTKSDVKVTQRGRTIVTIQMRGDADPAVGWWHAPLSLSEDAELGLGTWQQRTVQLREILKRTFDAFDVDWELLKGDSFKAKWFIGKETWALRELRTSHIGNKLCTVTKVMKETPLAVRLMAAPRPQLYDRTHLKVPMFEKYVFLPNGKNGVLTACGDLVPVQKVVGFDAGNGLKRLVDAKNPCSGCRTFADAWFESAHDKVQVPCDCEPDSCDICGGREPDHGTMPVFRDELPQRCPRHEVIHTSECAGRHPKYVVRTLTYESWGNFMAEKKFGSYFEPIRTTP